MQPTRSLLLAALAVALTACAPPIPDSGVQGPAFDTPAQAAARRDAQLAGTAPLRPVPIAGANLTDAELLAAQTRAALGQPFDPIAAPGPVIPLDQAGLDLDRNNPAISQEQDFAVVSAERGIDADAERLRIAREQYQVVTPTELRRPADTGPNVFDYALNRAKPVGETGAFGRGLRASANRAAQACGGYSSPDSAQEAFLAGGGPDRDKLGMDPDGDGNACAWDPAVVRNLVRQ